MRQRLGDFILALRVTDTQIFSKHWKTEVSTSPSSSSHILLLTLARVIMPRGQKSKHHARKKRDQARHEAQACVDAQETAEETPEAAGKSSAASKSQPGAESSSTPKAPQKATPSASSTLSFSTSESQERSCEESDESEEKECPVEVKPCTIPTHQDVIARKVLVLLQHPLHNYNLKKLPTKLDVLKIITRNKLKLPNNGRIRPGKGFPKTAFVMSVLGIILMNGNRASEEDIWKILKTQRVYPGKKHRFFGEPQKLLTEYLVKLKYLEYRQVAGSDPTRYEFLWGPQAHAETSKMKVLEYLSKINQTTPSAMSALHEEILKDLQEQAEARD
ncbi:hypothetical protein STEG23_003183 [Scotinomys teguina]